MNAPDAATFAPDPFDPLNQEWKVIAARIWGMLLHRLTPQQITALHRISRSHPTTSELAMYLEVSVAQAGNITRQLYTEGFLRREKAGRSYRWFPAFPAPSPFHYHDRSPIRVEGEAAERAIEILTRRGKL